MNLKPSKVVFFRVGCNCFFQVASYAVCPTWGFFGRFIFWFIRCMLSEDFFHCCVSLKNKNCTKIDKIIDKIIDKTYLQSIPNCIFLQEYWVKDLHLWASSKTTWKKASVFYGSLAIGPERTEFRERSTTFHFSTRFWKDLLWCDVKYFKINLVLMKDI